MAKIVDLIGQVYGKLTVIGLSEDKYRDKEKLWICHCSCGGYKNVVGYNLKKGATQSCGCLYSYPKDNLRKHSLSKSPEYRSWLAAKYRCLNPLCKRWNDYGGRVDNPVTFHEPWINDFQAFYNHAGPRPEPKHLYSLDRIDNDKGYEPGNVRWATAKTQANNRRK